jgi:hypothetical protein
VLPLLCNGLLAACPEEVPGPVLEQLQDGARANLWANLRQARELLSLLSLFEAHGISAIPYKGVALAQMIYGDLALRQSGDIDIIVKRQDVSRAKDLLVAHKYRLTWPAEPLSDSQEAQHLLAKYNYLLKHEDEGTEVELHWNVAPRYLSFPPNPEWLWGRLRATQLGGRSVSTFSPEDYLLILCVHGMNHCWNRLSWLCDVTELIKRGEALDWDGVVTNARQFGCARALSLALWLGRELLELPIPAAVWRQASRDRTARSLANQVIAQLLDSGRGAPVAFEIPRFHLHARERMRDRLRYCYFMAAPSARDWSTYSLPKSIAMFYYVLRPIRLVVEHGVNPVARRFRRV